MLCLQILIMHLTFYESVKFIIENAGANKAKAAELVERFAAARLDLIFTLARLS